jgi:predicted tellurium resistance membrane protein TerC
VGDFIDKRPTAKMLALSFILLVGVALIADGFGFHMPRGYLYFAIAFSLGVEILNGLYHKRRKVKRAKRIAAGKDAAH